MAARRRRAQSPFREAPARGPTARQRDFLRAVRELTTELERPPNATEIGARLGIRQVSAREQLRRLEAGGYLRDVPKTVSSGQWALTEPGLLEIDAGERSRLETGDW